MKHLRKFESFTFKRKLMEIIKEDVMVMGDTYKVRTSTDITQSMINAVIKSAKERTGVNLRQKYSDIQIAELIADYTKSQLNAENIPVQVFTGGEIPAGQGQAQGNQVTMSAQQNPTQVAPVAQAPMGQPAQPVQGQPVQGQPVQGQPAQGQPAQVQPAQVQPAQVQPAQVQQPNQNQEDFEEVDEEDPTKDEEDEEDEEGVNLPV